MALLASNRLHFTTISKALPEKMIVLFGGRGFPYCSCTSFILRDAHHQHKTCVHQPPAQPMGLAFTITDVVFCWILAVG